MKSKEKSRSVLSKVVGILNIIVGAVLIIGIYTFAHVCMMTGNMHTGTPACHDTRYWLLIWGAATLFIGLVMLLINSKGFNQLLRIIGIFLGAAMMVTPFFIAPTCTALAMHCNTHTKPFAVIVGLVLLLINLIFLIISRKLRKREKQDEADLKAIKEDRKAQKKADKTAAKAEKTADDVTEEVDKATGEAKEKAEKMAEDIKEETGDIVDKTEEVVKDAGKDIVEE